MAPASFVEKGSSPCISVLTVLLESSTPATSDPPGSSAQPACPAWCHRHSHIHTTSPSGTASSNFYYFFKMFFLCRLFHLQVCF